LLPAYRSLRPLVPWQEGELPIDWARRFEREAPLVLEIGFGNGEVLAREAARRPDANFVGVERRWLRVRAALRRIADARVPNVRLLHAPAETALGWLFAPRSIAAALSLFPCPWPRRSQERERLFGARFARLLNNRLVEGGRVEIVSDDRPYLEWVVQQVGGAGFETRLETAVRRYETKYERKWSARGCDEFFALELLKREHLDAAPAEGATLETYRVERFDPDRFSPRGVRGECAVEFRDFLFDATRRRGMVRVVVAEEGLTQDFWIEISWREGGWVIRPARGSWVLPTRGAARALEQVRAAAQES
jgi:tRNA (guanine-N7-)-methyltransferase